MFSTKNYLASKLKRGNKLFIEYKEFTPYEVEEWEINKEGEDSLERQ
jgi:hypothetical protein